MSGSTARLRLLLSSVCLSALSAACVAGDSTEVDDCSFCSNPAREFAGVWEPAVESVRDVQSAADPVFTPFAEEYMEHQIELRDAGKITYDYSAICIPPAAPTMTALGLQEIMVDEEKITWIIEATRGIRWIWTDGREHPPADELPLMTTNGHSVARWEGEVLVIDSIGFLDKSMVYVNKPGNISLYPSPEMRFVERLRLVEDGQAIISERTLYDPVNLAEPWQTTVRYERRDELEIGETICMENNQIFFYFEPGEVPGSSEAAEYGYDQ